MFSAKKKKKKSEKWKFILRRKCFFFLKLIIYKWERKIWDKVIYKLCKSYGMFVEREPYKRNFVLNQAGIGLNLLRKMYFVLEGGLAQDWNLLFSPPIKRTKFSWNIYLLFITDWFCPVNDLYYSL